MSSDQVPTGAEAAQAAELKEQGNALFAAKDYEAALALYDRGLALEPENSVLLGNKAACLVALERFEEALDAADRAVAAAPIWSKAHFRRSQALRSQGRYVEARDAMVAAHQHASGKQSKFLERQVAHLSRTVHEQDWTTPIESPDHWIRVFNDIPNIVLRLGTMVFFWNRSTRAERLLILQKALAILGPDSLGVDSSAFTEDRMEELPLQNYADLEVPEPWLAFFSALPSDAKVDTFSRMWEAASPQEKGLIVEDLRFFFVAPAAEGEEEGEAEEGSAGSGSAV